MQEMVQVIQEGLILNGELDRSNEEGTPSDCNFEAWPKVSAFTKP